MLASLRFAALFVAIPLFATARPLEREGTTLTWQFKAGEVLRYRMTTGQEIGTSMLPGQTSKTDMCVVIDQSVREVDAEGTASIDLSYEAMRMDSDMGGVEMHYDSQHTGGETEEGDVMLAKLLGPMLEAKIHLKIASNGRVSDISGMKEAMDKALEALPEEAGAGMAGMLKQMFGDDSMRKMLEVNVFPEKPLAAGDKWPRSMEVPAPMMGTLKFSMDNTFEGLEEHAGQSCARIGVLTRVTLEQDDTAQAAKKLDVKMNNSEGKATQWFSTKLGRLLENSMSMEMKMKMSFPSGGADPDEARSIDITSSIEVHMLLLGKDDPAFEVEQPKPADGKK